MITETDNDNVFIPSIGIYRFSFCPWNLKKNDNY